MAVKLTVCGSKFQTAQYTISTSIFGVSQRVCEKSAAPPWSCLSRSRGDDRRRANPALKGPYRKAQGNALGTSAPRRTFALKGRDRFPRGSSCSAPSGWRCPRLSTPSPGRCPGLSCLAPAGRKTAFSYTLSSVRSRFGTAFCTGFWTASTASAFVRGMVGPVFSCLGQVPRRSDGIGQVTPDGMYSEGWPDHPGIWLGGSTAHD